MSRRNFFRNGLIALVIGLVIVSCGGRNRNAQQYTTISENGETLLTLTVTEVVLDVEPSLTITALKLIDEEGNTIAPFYTKNLDQWFENAMVNQVFIPRETKWVYNSKDGYFKIEDYSKLLFEFNINDSIYSIGVGFGSKFVVQKSTDGKYTLLPEQTAELSPPPPTDLFDVTQVDKKPLFNGKVIEQGFTEYLAKNIKYPEEAKENKIEGNITVQFIIEVDGSISDTKVIRGTHPLLDAEALRVIENSPKWTPGIINGEKVRVIIRLPIRFRL